MRDSNYMGADSPNWRESPPEHPPVKPVVSTVTPHQEYADFLNKGIIMILFPDFISHIYYLEYHTLVTKRDPFWSWFWFETKTTQIKCGSLTWWLVTGNTK